MIDTKLPPLPAELNPRVIDAWRWDAGPPVEGVDMGDLLPVIFPGYWTESRFYHITWEEREAAVSAWCAANGAYLYSRGKEDFSVPEARSEALAAGVTRVVLENLS